MSQLDTIFQSPHAHELFHAVRDHIFKTKCGHLEPFESYSKRLTEGERIVILVTGFVWEVTNGGLSQFLSNSTGDHSEEIREVMRKIGATVAADALDDVRRVIFRDAPIPTDRSTRCDILFSWEEHDEESAEAFFDKHKLGWCETVENGVAQYIRTHREMFS